MKKYIQALISLAMWVIFFSGTVGGAAFFIERSREKWEDYQESKKIPEPSFIMGTFVIDPMHVPHLPGSKIAECIGMDVFSKRLSEKEMLSLLKNPYLVARGKMLCELVKCDKCYPVMVGNGVLEFKE